MRKAFLAKRPDASLGELHNGSCSEDIHMEKEKIEIKIQEDEVEDVRDKRRMQNENPRENRHLLQAHDTWMG